MLQPFQSWLQYGMLLALCLPDCVYQPINIAWKHEFVAPIVDYHFAQVHGRQAVYTYAKCIGGGGGVYTKHSLGSQRNMNGINEI